MSSELIFVTGSTGFVGSHVVDLLLQEGYRVRAAARGAKVGLLRKAYSKYLGQLEVVDVADAVTADLTDVLMGVTAVIHIATTSPGRGDNELIYKESSSVPYDPSAIGGSMNVITQSQKAGIKKIVFTSSIATVLGTGSWTDQDWNPITREQADKGGPFEAYMLAKTLAEREVWKFADDHPEVDFTVLNPPYMFGSIVPGHIIPETDYAALTTNLLFARLLRVDGALKWLTSYLDIRDNARAHVAALKSPPESVVGRKRILLSSPHGLDYKKAIEILARERPELKDRLADPARASTFTADPIPIDLKRAKNVLGIDEDSYHSWEKTVLDTADSLITLEKEWQSRGYNVEFPNA